MSEKLLDLDTAPHTPPQHRADPTSSSPVVAISGLEVKLTRNGKTETVLHSLDLDIQKGEVLGLVGQSGSGKSVLGLTLMGLLPDRSRPEITGSVSVCGTSVIGASARSMRNLRRNSLGVIFQDPMTSLNPTMTIGHQVLEAAGTKAEALRLLALAGISNPETRYDAFPHQLSGGLRQRVMIAMAVAGSPALIIADEPTTALDVTVQRQVLDLLRELKSQLHCSVLMVTHDLGVAGEISDRIAVMSAGRLVEIGPAATILSSPKHEYTRALLASRISLDTDKSLPLPTFNLGGDEPTVASDEVFDTFVQPPVDAPLSVDVTNVSKTFSVRGKKGANTLRALHDVSLAIADGESVAIVGESGSGKSTLLRIIAGLETADAGVGSISRMKGSRPQMVFQDAGASLTPWLRVDEILRERLVLENVPSSEFAERISESLALVGLGPEILRVHSRDLSGGQRQRVALARAAIVPPSILLCDEPTSALDAWMAATVINLLRRLRKRVGMSMLFVTHDLSVARVIADRIVVMNKGEIVEIGEANQIIHNPQNEYTKKLVAAIPDLTFAEELAS
ncbi:ABC transporter ATP-binding protein [Glaciihabitans sp. dw_435]|uniref:ATP-binding cassette domain-containing protein n=1 Tax=Glaciihabitans sp. dw_435 TaxID=2720081 RepID=UPI001BD646F4|nr:ABC transporter ATP-binding protein [Glaciihabitans sp. dw_435]